MKNKKAFTLIEVIGIIVILGLILIIAVPSMTKTLKRNEQKKYDNYINNLKLVSDHYLVDQLQKKNITFKDDVTYFSLGDIIDAGYIKDIITNPNNNKKISRDTRIKVTKNLDSTYSYEIQEYYNNVSDYDKEDLIIHYDSVKYTGLNKFENNTNEVDYDFNTSATWTENGMLFEKNSISSISLNNSYSTDNITVSFNIKSLEELGTCNDCYTYPINIYNNSNSVAKIGFRKDLYLFYYSGNNSVLYSGTLEMNKNYTITFVQDGLTTRKIYINGVFIDSKANLNLETISYNKINISPLLYNLELNNILVYNRALTESEIKNLYSLDKDRFGE